MGTPYAEALMQMESYERVRLIPRAARRAYISAWTLTKDMGRDDHQAELDARVMARKTSNPLVWWAVLWALEHILLPLLKKWWDNR